MVRVINWLQARMLAVEAVCCLPIQEAYFLETEFMHRHDKHLFGARVRIVLVSQSYKLRAAAFND